VVVDWVGGQPAFERVRRPDRDVGFKALQDAHVARFTDTETDTTDTDSDRSEEIAYARPRRLGFRKGNRPLGRRRARPDNYPRYSSDNDSIELDHDRDPIFVDDDDDVQRRDGGTGVFFGC
jgi:hypothetical protein